VSHYDSQTATVMGAYDDMSGVAAEFSICKALAHVPMERTLACIFFDGEERGLVASEHYVQDAVKDGDEGYVYDLVMGYDMTGLNWPGYSTWKMYVMTGPVDDVPALVPFANGLMHTTLGYPDSGVEVLDVHDRNSDERNFKEAGVPILRFAGGRNAADYDQYHKPLDTVDHVYQTAGGRGNFEKGFATIVEASYTTALAFDHTSMAELHATYG
jgi:Zn-dependent M28 family amino/carboxypeptidase